MDTVLDVTRRHGEGGFPADFLSHYIGPDKDGNYKPNEAGYLGTVAKLNRYGITFGSPKPVGSNQVVVIVESDNEEYVGMVKRALSKWGTVTAHKGQQAASGGQTAAKPP